METVAFYGAGMLGSGFVKNLRRHGYTVHVWNRTFEKAKALEEDGIIAFRDAAEAARGAARIHICVRDDDSVDSILQAALPGIDRSAIIADHTTVLPQNVVARAKRLSDAGFSFLHAPVFMGPPNALSGTGTMMVSGPQAIFDEIKDRFAQMTGTVKYFGERPDLAAVYKLMGNAMILAVIAGLNDIYRIGEEQGLTRPQAYELFSFYSVQGQIDGRGKRMAEGDYTPTWTLDMAHKDATLMQKAAKGAKLPVIDAIEAELRDAMSHGHASEDLGAIAAR